MQVNLTARLFCRKDFLMQTILAVLLSMIISTVINALLLKKVVERTTLEFKKILEGYNGLIEKMIKKGR